MRLTMPNYINTTLLRFQHAKPTKPTHSPHPHKIPTYGQTKQCAPAPDLSPPLNGEETKRLQAITGALL